MRMGGLVARFNYANPLTWMLPGGNPLKQSNLVNGNRKSILLQCTESGARMPNRALQSGLVVFLPSGLGDRPTGHRPHRLTYILMSTNADRPFLSRPALFIKRVEMSIFL